MFQEVLFRKQNDEDFNYLTRNMTSNNTEYSIHKQACELTSQRQSRMKNCSRISDLVGNTNDGKILKEANKSAFMLKRNKKMD